MRRLHRLLHWLRTHRSPRLPAGASADARWYDSMYRRQSAAYYCHYTASPYYFVWTVIADRVRTADSILEIGCGPGQLAQCLMEQRPRDYVGVDISEVAVNLARERVPEARFFVQDVTDGAAVKAAGVDVVIATEVLEHLDDDLGLLGRLAPGTRVVATVPNFDWPSHVRYFPNSQAVLERYASMFAEVDVVAIPKNEAGRVFFLVDGIIASGIDQGSDHSTGRSSG